MMITALIRTHGTRDVTNTVKSCEGINVIVQHFPTVGDYSYNLYCNEMKSQVTDGYFFFLDSDDAVIPGAVDKITPHLREDRALIVQMLRNGLPKPRRQPPIRRGAIGMPCMVLHHTMKDVADLDDTGYADYTWIKAVTDKVPYLFVPIPLVNAGKRGMGK